eukprot:10865387-Heterocapsa_arctica.AAC.1
MFCHMRMFCIVTTPLWSAHGRRAMYVKTPKLGLLSNIADAGGRWHALLRKTVHVSLFDQTNMSYIGFGEQCTFSDDQMAEKVFDFLMGFLNARAQSQVLHVSSYPEASVLALSETAEEVATAMVSMNFAWDTLLWAESLAPVHPGMMAVLSAVPWSRHVIPILIFLMLESEGWQMTDVTKKLLMDVHLKLPDTK